MNDALCEHIVARKSKPMDFIIRILIIVVIVAVAIGGLPFLGFLHLHLQQFWLYLLIILHFHS